MGNSESVHNAHDYKMHNAPVKLPMPEQKELNARFERVLVSTVFELEYMSWMNIYHGAI